LVSLILLRGLTIGLKEIVPDIRSEGGIPDEDEIPRLHKSDGRGMMRRQKNAAENIVRDGCRQELVPDVAPLKHSPVHGAALSVGERVLTGHGRVHFVHHVDGVCP